MMDRAVYKIIALLIFITALICSSLWVAYQIYDCVILMNKVNSCGGSDDCCNAFSYCSRFNIKSCRSCHENVMVDISGYSILEGIILIVISILTSMIVVYIVRKKRIYSPLQEENKSLICSLYGFIG